MFKKLHRKKILSTNSTQTSLWTLSNLTFSELDPRVRTNWILLTFILAQGTLFFQCGLNASLKSPWKNLTWSPMNAQCRWNQQRQQTLFKVLHEILRLSCAKMNKLTYLQICQCSEISFWTLLEFVPIISFQQSCVYLYFQVHWNWVPFFDLRLIHPSGLVGLNLLSLVLLLIDNVYL